MGSVQISGWRRTLQKAGKYFILSTFNDFFIRVKIFVPVFRGFRLGSLHFLLEITQDLQEGFHIIGRVRGKLQVIPCLGMDKTEATGMQHLSVYSGQFSSLMGGMSFPPVDADPVNAVPNDGMTQVREMHANLVCPSGPGLQLQQRKAAEGLEYFVESD